jgi:hypothetical protein
MRWAGQVWKVGGGKMGLFNRQRQVVEPTAAERAVARRLAARALGDAGRRYLADLGLRRRKSSPRLWWLDRGWWLINVEFQPSSWSVGSYLNVGLQHLWDVRDSRVFEWSQRVPIGAHGQFVDLVGDEAVVRNAAAAVGVAARQSVQSWLARLPDDGTHLRALVDRGGRGWDGFNAAVAAQLLGDSEHARAVFHTVGSDVDRSIPWQRELADDCHRLATLTASAAQFRTLIEDRTRATRTLLKLEAPAGEEPALLPRA